MQAMPDGSRKRRHSTNASRRRWYALYRSWRFQRRFGFTSWGESSESMASQARPPHYFFSRAPRKLKRTRLELSLTAI